MKGTGEGKTKGEKKKQDLQKGEKSMPKSNISAVAHPVRVSQHGIPAMSRIEKLLK